MVGLLLSRPAAAAEKQIRPFVGVTFAGATTFVDFENAAGGPNGVIGAAAVWLGDIVGVEADLGWARSFFQSGDQHQVLHSGVTTATGSIVLTLPRRLTEYTLRPYLVAGAGVMHVAIEHPLGVLPVTDTLPVIDLGAGAVGFVTNRVGVAWDIRRLGSIKDRTAPTGVTIGGAARLSFWRASMAVAFRY